MNSIEIAIKNKTNLTLQLEKIYAVSYYQPTTFFSKITFQKTKDPDIYFHQGQVDQDAITLAKKSKLVIVNSHNIQAEFLQNSQIKEDQIEVITPYYHTATTYDKKIKKSFKNHYKIKKDQKILFFRGSHLLKSGLDVVLDTMERLYKKNMTLVIESNNAQIEVLKKKFEKEKISFPYLLFADYPTIEELFIAADIFLLPTSLKSFSLDVIKAFYFRNAVFVTENNNASEIVDVFSTIQGASDRSISFKIDSLLANPDELKKIQKENQKIGMEMNLSNSFEKITKIINKSFDF